VPIARRLWQQAQPNGSGETIEGHIRSPKEGEAVAVDGDTGSRPEIVPNRSEQHSVATVPDHSGDWKNVASNGTKSNHPPVTSFRQIEANRRNALRSTGPTTADGKGRSPQNAIRHGLSAETVVEIVEDIDDYRGFEAAVIADYDARTAVERENWCFASRRYYGDYAAPP
jgi:hypothetical protein